MSKFHNSGHRRAMHDKLAEGYVRYEEKQHSKYTYVSPKFEELISAGFDVKSVPYSAGRVHTKLMVKSQLNLNTRAPISAASGVIVVSLLSKTDVLVKQSFASSVASTVTEKFLGIFSESVLYTAHNFKHGRRIITELVSDSTGEVLYIEAPKEDMFGNSLQLDTRYSVKQIRSPLKELFSFTPIVPLKGLPKDVLDAISEQVDQLLSSK